MPFLTVTFNPALDMTGTIGVLQPGDVNLVQNYTLHPAGKGVNVARVLSDLGANVSVSGFLGTDNQDPFSQLFAEQGIADHFFTCAGGKPHQCEASRKCWPGDGFEFSWHGGGPDAY